VLLCCLQLAVFRILLLSKLWFYLFLLLRHLPTFCLFVFALEECLIVAVWGRIHVLCGWKFVERNKLWKITIITYYFVVLCARTHTAKKMQVRIFTLTQWEWWFFHVRFYS
jgi:hypothetical protein